MQGKQILIVLPQWNKALDWHLSTPTHYMDSLRWPVFAHTPQFLKRGSSKYLFFSLWFELIGDQSHDVLHSRWTCCPLHHWGSYCGEKNLTSMTYVPVMHGRFFPASSLCHDISKMLPKMLNTSYFLYLLSLSIKQRKSLLHIPNLILKLCFLNLFWELFPL